MSEKIQNIALVVLIVSVAIMTLLGVLSIWDFLDNDVLAKSLSTIGVITFASLVTFAAAKAFKPKGDASMNAPVDPTQYPPAQ